MIACNNNVGLLATAIGVLAIYLLFFNKPSKHNTTGYRPSVSSTSLHNKEFFRPHDKLDGNDPPPHVDDKCAGNFIASHLLPKADPKFKEWSDLAPTGPLDGNTMLLDPLKVIGYDTVGNHLKNASYDLRKEPSCPTKAVSPWINSTIGPDLMRKPLEDCNMWTMSSNKQH